MSLFIYSLFCRKVRLEKEIESIEADLEKLSKGNIIIDMTR